VLLDSNAWHVCPEDSTGEFAVIKKWLKAFVSGSGPNNALNLDSNPLIIDEAGLQDPSAGDFRLKQDSPLIDSAARLNEVPTDKDGITRPAGSGWDIGAYEFAPKGEDPKAHRRDPSLPE
jgi:hypothetical protein